MIISIEEIKDLIKNFFEHVYDQDDLKCLKVLGEDYKANGYTATNITNVELYKLYSVDSYFFSKFDEIDETTLKIIFEDIIMFMTEYVYYNVFKFCACGYSEKMKGFILDCLNLFDSRSVHMKPDEEAVIFNRESVKEKFGIDVYDSKTIDTYPPMSMWFIMYQFDALRLSIHGINGYKITGAWLTDKGKTVRRILNLWKEVNDNDS